MHSLPVAAAAMAVLALAGAAISAHAGETTTTVVVKTDASCTYYVDAHGVRRATAGCPSAATVNTYPYAAAPLYGYYAPYPPPGAVAATTGTYGYSSGTVSGTTRASAGYDPWTGNAAAGRTTTGYDSATGTRAIGQRGGAANAYTGDYAYGERGAAYNERTGAAAAGGRATFGNAATGHEVQAARGVAYDPATGEIARGRALWGENGGVARVNGQTYVGRNGNVQQVSRSRPSGQRTRPAGRAAR